MSLSQKQKTVLFVVLLPALVAIGAGFLLTAIFGPSDWGIECTRSPVAQCRVLQTRFLGLWGKSDFVIPEADIRGVKTVRPTANIGGHAGTTFTVNLILDPKWPYPNYPVLSYEFERQADASTQKLNAYLNDKSVPAIEIRDDVLTPFLVKGAGPLILVCGILGVRWWLRKRAA